MEAVYEQLTKRALALQQQIAVTVSNDESNGSIQVKPRVLVALAGPPGSGKSTIATEVVKRLNQQPHNTTSTQGNDQQYNKTHAIVLPMDGFHYSRSHLDSMSNALEAHARRGVYWTFDAQGVIELIKLLHKTRLTRDTVLTAPSFDHATKDPVADAITISTNVDFILIEGNWLLFNEEPWYSVAGLVDDTWFVDVEPELALQRVAKRHLQAGIENTWEKALRRAKENDMVNGVLVREKLVVPNVKVWSVEKS